MINQKEQNLNEWIKLANNLYHIGVSSQDIMYIVYDYINIKLNHGEHVYNSQTDDKLTEILEIHSDEY